jgi:branched-chain amino acid transport system ATP-binding protein
MLSIREVTAGYSGTDVLRGISLDVSPGECLGVLGPNGAGKSSLLKVLSGQLRIRRGSREIDGRDVRKWSPHEAARCGVRWVGEPRPVYPRLTVEENLEVGGVIARSSIAQRRQDVYELLPVLREKRRQLAAQLSGGQQQMLAIGQALMSAPRYLCLDEPSTGLSPLIVKLVADLVSELVAEGVSVIWAEQFPEVARARSTKLVVLSAGVVVASGRSADVTGQQLEAVYLGGELERDANGAPEA